MGKNLIQRLTMAHVGQRFEANNESQHVSRINHITNQDPNLVNPIVDWTRDRPSITHPQFTNISVLIVVSLVSWYCNVLYDIIMWQSQGSKPSPQIT